MRASVSELMEELSVSILTTVSLMEKSRLGQKRLQIDLMIPISRLVLRVQVFASSVCCRTTLATTQKPITLRKVTLRFTSPDSQTDFSP